MVFLIQNTQNRDAKAIHLKLDELIRAKKRPRNSLVDLENCTDEELEQIERNSTRAAPRAVPSLATRFRPPRNLENSLCPKLFASRVSPTR